MTTPSNIAAVNTRLAAEMAALARELTGHDPTSRNRTEWRFGRKGSLAVVAAGPKRGAWHDHEAGRGGDPLGLVAHLRRVSMGEAYAWALGWLGIQQQQHPVQGRLARVPGAQAAALEPAADARKRWSHDLAARLWREAVDPADTTVERYLASRGLELPLEAPLRFHPAAWRNRDNGPCGPAMLALTTAPEADEPVGLHVTYLRADGRGKAAGNRPKVMLGARGVVRLVPDAEVTLGLGLAEGIETALAVMQRYGWRPVWAAGSAGGIAGFPVLPGIEALTVFADVDDGGAGRKAAEECAARWHSAGREARITPALAGKDFADLVGRVA